MSSGTLAGFVAELDLSALLDTEQRSEVRRLQTKVHDARGLAQELMRRNWLSAFQINQIFLGKGAGLTIGPYVLIERIGEGGMGQVYKARHKTLGRLVALKVIRKECLGNPKAIKRFQREIRAASQLCHPHIVRAYDADQLDGTYYFAMELIEGTDLARMVKDFGPLRVDQACEYIRQAALGLQHASERGMVHRDIKPANLLVARAVKSDRHRSSACHRRPSLDAKKTSAAVPRVEADYQWGVVKILDMGLARCSDPATGRSATLLTQIGSVMGTPDYIAPEQARDSHASDVRADLYSLGCTFYFLLGGQVPFPEGNLTEKLLQHQFDVAEPIARVRRKHFKKIPGSEDMIPTPAAVEAVVNRLLAKDPADRFQTPMELADVLQSLIPRLADGSLARADKAKKVDAKGVEPTTKPSPAAKVESASGSMPTLLALDETNTRHPVAKKAKLGRTSLWLAFAGGLCAVLLATMAVAVIGAGSRTQANPVMPEAAKKTPRK